MRLDIVNKIQYLAECVRKNTNHKNSFCPSCGCEESSFVSRKYLVTALRRCNGCQLLFRTPTTDFTENASFYQEDYVEGFTTDCPNDQVLSEYLETSFRGTEKDYSRYIDVIYAAGASPGDRIFDFGCSWGYGSWQIAQRGFDVECYEISLPRAHFARDKLGLKVHPSLSEVGAGFDVFFSAHVLEHVPSVEEVINFGMSILKPHGLFIAFTPNGSTQYREVAEESWNKLWGMVHPNFLDEKFYKSRFTQSPPLILSNPFSLDVIREWEFADKVNHHGIQLNGDELLLIVRNNT